MIAASGLWAGETARGAQSRSTATSGTRPIPPLPPTLVLEGAAQPFLLQIVASQASRRRRPSGPVMPGRVALAPVGQAMTVATPSASVGSSVA
jgi:hypothetical protein